MSELTRRIIFAVIAAPASIAIVYFGDWALAIVLSGLAAFGAWEFFRMAREHASQEEIEKAAYELGETNGLSRDEVRAVAKWVNDQILASRGGA